MIASGCLLIFADDVSTLPLGETLPWESMSLQVPEATPAALSSLVEALSDVKLDEMLRQWRAVSPKLLSRLHAYAHHGAPTPPPHRCVRNCSSLRVPGTAPSSR